MDRKQTLVIMCAQFKNGLAWTIQVNEQKYKAYHNERTNKFRQILAKKMCFYKCYEQSVMTSRKKTRYYQEICCSAEKTERTFRVRIIILNYVATVAQFSHKLKPKQRIDLSRLSSSKNMMPPKSDKANAIINM